MSTELLTALLLFAFVSAITPGPNNTMLLTSGLNFGFMRSIRHPLGITIGFAIMSGVIGLSFIHLFEQYPRAYLVLQIACVSYMLYLAYKLIGFSGQMSTATPLNQPISFKQALLFQWLNPKAWTMAITANSIYAPHGDLYSISIIAFIFALMTFPSSCLWLLMGQKLRLLLNNPRYLKGFNLLMAGMLLLSLYPMLLSK